MIKVDETNYNNRVILWDSGIDNSTIKRILKIIEKRNPTRCMVMLFWSSERKLNIHNILRNKNILINRQFEG